MTSKTEIISIARNYLRDFPKFFQVSFAPDQGRTYNLGKPNVDAGSLWVAFLPSAGSGSATVLDSTSYALDERNGLLRLDNSFAGDQVMIEGYYYEWLTPTDLSFYADMAIHMNEHSIDIPVESFAPAVADVVGIHTLVQALMGLLTEYSRDIDVITSESVHIIASQRYRMVFDLLNFWTAEYNKRAQALNIGLDRIEMLTLRRISRTTGRYVPIWKGRELYDFEPPTPIWPPIDDGVISIEDEPDDGRDVVYVDGPPPPSYVTPGTYS